MVKTIVDKLFSARFVLATAFGLTACVGFLKGRISAEVFVPVVILIVKDYFERKDRNGTVPPTK